MATKIIFRKKEFEVKPGMTLQSALSKIRIHPTEVIAIRDGEMITEDEILKDGQTIRLIPVISGGSV
jgi:sulfur carrier protein